MPCASFNFAVLTVASTKASPSLSLIESHCFNPKPRLMPFLKAELTLLITDNPKHDNHKPILETALRPISSARHCHVDIDHQVSPLLYCIYGTKELSYSWLHHNVVIHVKHKSKMIKSSFTRQGVTSKHKSWISHGHIPIPNINHCDTLS